MRAKEGLPGLCRVVRSVGIAATTVAAVGVPAVSLCLAPPAPSAVKVKRKPADGEWRTYPVRTVEMLPGFSTGDTETAARCKFGGRLDASAATKATGFFRTERDARTGRWWLVDPDGHRFLHVAVNSVAPGTSPTQRKALGERFEGSPARWAEQTVRLLRETGFNGVGSWSDAPVLRQAAAPVSYAAMGTSNAPSGGVRGGFMQAFGRKLGITRPGSGHTSYPNDCLPVFHPDFAAFCDEHAKPLAALKNDPYLIGYFSDNEMPPPRLEKYLALDPADPHLGTTAREARRWLASRRGGKATVADVSDADRDAWAEHVYDRYFAVTTTAIRKHDPNHLCLGSRFYSSEKRWPGAFRAAGRYLDVIAVNHYGAWDPRPADLQRWTNWSNKPVLITEWYAKGMDSGLPNVGGAGWVVPTQNDRGLFYQTFTLGLLEAKNIVGWHWFKYQDNDPADRTADPSNQDSNKGIVDARYTAYAPLVAHMKTVNDRVYALADYFDGRQNHRPTKEPASP
jgi:hypothetical protein